MSFAAGILLSHAIRLEAWHVALGIGLAICLRLAWRRVRLPSILLTFLLGGVLIDILNRPGRAPEIDASSRETVLLDGCVVEPTVFNQDHDQFTLELARHARVRVTLTTKDGETPPDLPYGKAVEIEGRVRKTRNFQNPGGFDYVAWSARKNIYWTASARSADSVKLLPGACGSSFNRAIFALRTAALRRIEAMYAHDPYATGMMESILIGDTTKIEKIWTENFRRTGTFHALVISGLHIMVLATALLFLLRILFVGELPALAITTAITWIYVLIAGWNPPAVRAAGGFTMYMIGRYFYRERRILNLLAFVGLVYLALDPGELFEAGFQLSFLSVAAIAVLAGPILEKTTGRYRPALPRITETRRDLRLDPRAAQFRIELRLLAETFSYYLKLPAHWLLSAMTGTLRVIFFIFDIAVVSTVMQIGLALPMAIYFHRVSFSGLSANVIIVPLLSLVVPIGFLAIFTGWPFVAHFAGWLLMLSEKVAHWHVRWEPDIRIPDPPLWLSIAFSAAILGLAFTMRRSRAWRWSAIAVAAGLFALVVIYPFPPKVTPGSLELTAIDVGQGDSLLIAFPNGKLMLVDGGGVLAFGHKVKPKLDIGEDVVSPYLWTRSISHLDVVVATHAHEDHTGGLGAILDNFHPPELWTGANTDEPLWRELSRHAAARGVKIVSMRGGRAFDFGGARIEVLSPPEDYLPNDTPKNNDSLAFRVTYGEHSFLLTGDMEKPMENRLIADDKPLRADVLKVGHHGSKTSSSDLFLDAVQPRFAIISNGFENSFGHPNRDVLDRLEAHHASVLRTDTVGLITIRSDGKNLSVSRFADSAPHP